MNKGEFLSQLRLRLGALSKQELEKTIQYYSEIIDDMLEEGVSEEDAVANLESVEEIASRIIEENAGALQSAHTDMAQSRKKTRTWLVVLLICLFPVWITLFCVYIAVWAAVASLLAAGAGMALSLPLTAITAVFTFMETGWYSGVFEAGAALIISGLGILLFIGMIYLIKSLIRFTGFIFNKLRGKDGV